jgi:hypothetical protein
MMGLNSRKVTMVYIGLAMSTLLTILYSATLPTAEDFLFLFPDGVDESVVLSAYFKELDVKNSIIANQLIFAAAVITAFIGGNVWQKYAGRDQSQFDQPQDCVINPREDESDDERLPSGL